MCLPELTLSRYFAVDPAGAAAAGASRGAAGRADVLAGLAPGTRARRSHSRFALRGAEGPTDSVTTRRSSSNPKGARRTHPKAPYPDHCRLPRVALLPPGPRGRGVDQDIRGRRRAGRPADVLGPVVPGARSRILPGRRRRPRLPDGDRLRARPPGLRHRAAVARGHGRPRDRQRALHRRCESLRQRGRADFYGSSFVADPYGRVLVSAPRDEPAVLVADLDLDQRRDWLDLFPFPRDAPAGRVRDARLGTFRLSPSRRGPRVAGCDSIATRSCWARTSTCCRRSRTPPSS